jgi:hypothetical protein
MAARNNKLTASQIFDLNATGYPQYGIGLGTELAEPKNLKDKNIDQTSTDENFFGYIDYSLKGGGAAANTDTGINVFKTLSGNKFELYSIATRTLFAPTQTAAGLDISGDTANGDGVDMTMGCLANYGKHIWTVGTNKFYFESKISMTTVANTDLFAVGFRKAEAANKVYDNYDELCAINIDSGDVIWSSILNNAATNNVDTGLNVGNGEYIIIRLEYDHTKGLSSAIALANDVKRLYNIHCANTAKHTTAADSVNVITAADATNLTTLIALITDELTQYDAHDNDAEQAVPTYHAAQETGDDSLVSAVAPITLSTCITKLNDLKAKFAQHNADATAHAVVNTADDTGLAYASSVTFKYGINTGDLTTYCNSAKGFCFDLNEVVIPFIHYMNNAGGACVPIVQTWKAGLL